VDQNWNLIDKRLKRWLYMNEEEIIAALKKMKKEGTLSKSLPQVIEYAKELSSNSLEKAGYILRDISFADWMHPEAVDLKPIKIAVISNFTADSLSRYLCGLLIQEGIWPEFYIAPYNQYVYQLMGEKSDLYRFEPDITFCLLDEMLIFEECQDDDWTVEDIKYGAKQKIEQLRLLIEMYQRHCKGLLVLNTIPFPEELHSVVIDYKSKAMLSKEWRLFEANLLGFSDHYQQVITLDLSILLQNVSQYRDARLSYYASMKMSDEMLLAISEEGLKISRSILGLNKKCLTLDLDETLWGGIVGDDGLDGIQLGNTSPGNIFIDFQNKINMLKKQGVLLAINSKNEEKNVKEIFEKHPDMVLKQDDFVIICSNWNAKHENLKKIASHLNIGLDSFVFLDDSPFERNMVREYMTDVTVPEMPKDPSFYVETLLKPGWFNCIALTKEDSQRTDKYRQIVKRKEFQDSASSIEEYLQGLDVNVFLLNTTKMNLPRLHQLNTRTNQFNLTTRRYQESEIKEMSEQDRYLIIGFQATDRFGDNGIVGSVYIEKIVDEGNEEWWIRNFIMSCRVFSRDIETAVLHYILDIAKEKGVSSVFGEYIPSKKNGYVQNFYSDHGFQAISKDQTPVIYRHSLDPISLKETWVTLHPFKEGSTV